MVVGSRCLTMLLVFAALAGSCASAATASAAGAEEQLRGVHLHSLWWESSTADMDRELDLSRDLGANVVRVDVGWDTLEGGGKGNYASWYLSKLDRFVNGANARGMRVIVTLLSTPCWASSAPAERKQGCDGQWWSRNVQMYPPTKASDYGDIARFITSRYGTKLAALEVWNEPNLDVDRFFVAPDEPEAYARILKAAYPAAKQGNPDVDVLAGSLAYMNGAFLERLYELGIKGFYDGLAVHPYNDGAPTASNWSGLQWVRSLQRAAGDHAPLWITEFGWSSCAIGSGWCKSAAQQAASTHAAFDALEGDPGVRAAIVYNLRDKGTNASSMEDNFGLVRRDFTPKPAFYAMRDALGGVPAPPAPPVSPAPAPVIPPPATLPTPGALPTGPVAAPVPPRADGMPRRVRSRRAGGRVVVRLRRRGGVAVAFGRAPRRSRVILRTRGCRGAYAARVIAVRANARGRFARRIGPARRFAGCRVIAALDRR